MKETPEKLRLSKYLNTHGSAMIIIPSRLENSKEMKFSDDVVHNIYQCNHFVSVCLYNKLHTPNTFSPLLLIHRFFQEPFLDCVMGGQYFPLVSYPDMSKRLEYVVSCKLPKMMYVQ